MSTMEGQSTSAHQAEHSAEVGSKRPREEGEEELLATTADTAAPRPPPLKMLSAESLEAKAPAPMVRIKSRASLSSPTTPAIAVAGLKVSSPSASAAPPTLKILSPTTRSPLGGSGPRFGSPTDRTPKSPARYSSFSSANNSSAASAAISQDPRERFCTLFHRLLTQASDGSYDEAKVKEASMSVAEALMGLTETVRVERTKSLLHHLSDPKNKNLRISIRSGTISGEQLVSLDPKKLMNPEKQQEVQAKIEWSEKDRNLVELASAKKISSTMYECPKCKKRDCTFYEKQTRSADEPMTQFINCNVCKYNWKIY